MNECRTFSVLLATLLLAPGVQAQEAALTLERTVQLARERAPQLQARAAALESARALAVAAGRLPDPQLVTGIDNLPVTSDDAGSVSRDFMTMRKIGVMQEFPNAHKRAAQRAAAQAGISVVQSETLQADLEIARVAAQAWVDVYVADRLEANLSTLGPELELQAQAVNAALRSGRASSVDALTAQAAIFEFDDRLIVARREQRAARVALGRWIGDEAHSATLSTVTHFDNLPYARETLLASLHQHASLLAYEAQMALARTEIDIARADKRADWSAALSYARRGDAFSDMVSVEFRVGLPLFSRHRQDPVISARRAELEQLESQRETELRMHAEAVANTLSSWQSARDRMQLYERERAPLARQRTRTALAGYRGGGTALTEVLSSIVAEVELQQAYSELSRELGRAWVYLRYLQLQESSPP